MTVEIKVGQKWRYTSAKSEKPYEVKQDLGKNQWLVQHADGSHHIFYTIDFHFYTLLPEPLPAAAFPTYFNVYPHRSGGGHASRGEADRLQNSYDHSRRVAVLRIDIDSSGNPTITREDI